MICIHCQILNNLPYLPFINFDEPEIIRNINGTVNIASMENKECRFTDDFVNRGCFLNRGTAFGEGEELFCKFMCRFAAFSASIRLL